MSRLGFGVLDVVQRQVQLIIVRFRLAAILRASIGQHADHTHVVLLEERQHPVIEQIGRRDRRLDRVQLGHGHFAVRVDEGLLVDPGLRP